MTTRFVQMRSSRLRSAIDDTATECVLQEFVGLSGEDITQADFGTKGWGTFEPNTAREEAVEFEVTANTDGIATLTLIRGLRGKAPYGAGGTAFAHQAGSEFVVSNNPDLFNKLTAKDNDEVVSGSWKFPVTPTHNQNPTPKIYVDEEIEGVNIRIDDEVAAIDANIDELDEANVKITGDQTIEGVKTFSSSPIVPDATAAQQPITKAQLDAAGESFSATASPTVRGTTKLDVAADDVLDPKALTATAARAAALAGGDDFGTPSASNKFVTEEKFTPAFNEANEVNVLNRGYTVGLMAPDYIKPRFVMQLPFILHNGVQNTSTTTTHTNWTYDGDTARVVIEPMGIQARFISNGARALFINLSSANFGSVTQYNTFTQTLTLDWWAQLPASAGGDIMMGFGENTVTSYSDVYTSTGHGRLMFAQSGATLYAVVSKNATGTTATDVSAGITLTEYNNFRIEFIGQTSAKFYINGVLVHTDNNTANFPDNARVMGFGFGKNGAGAVSYNVMAPNLSIDF